MVITMLKIEEIREQFLGQICELLVSVNIGNNAIVDPGGCPVLVVNIEHVPQYYSSHNLYLFTLLHSFHEIPLFHKHYLIPDMLRVVS